MATLKNIDNPVWALSVIGYGVIVEGIAAIRQRMDLAIRTTRGTDPMRPEFGSNIFKYVDAPVNVAVPNVKAEIVNALRLWVPEVTVSEIRHSFASHFNPVFEITYRLTDEDLADKLVFDLKNGNTTVLEGLNEIILQAFFPPNPSGFRYQVRFQKNGAQVLPVPNPSGYATPRELYDWISANWFFVGRWYLLEDRIVCYLNSEGVNSVSLAIDVLPIVRFQAGFPQLSPGEVYHVLFSVNGVPVTPEMPAEFETPGQVLAFAQSNWTGQDWFIEYGQSDADAVFSNEFSDEFAVASTGYSLVGVSNESGFVANLQISTL